MFPTVKTRFIPLHAAGCISIGQAAVLWRNRFGEAPLVTAMKIRFAIALLIGPLLPTSPARAGDAVDPLQNFNFPDSAIVFPMDAAGTAGLRGPRNARISRATDGSDVAVLSGVAALASPGYRPGIFLTIGEKREAELSGELLTVTVIARSAPTDPEPRVFSVSYSTADVGNSGWHLFPLSREFQAYSFSYRVPSMERGQRDFIGILPDSEGRGGTVEVAAIVLIPEDHREFVSTAFYDLAIERLPLPGGSSRRGAIAAVGPLIVYASQKGILYSVEPEDGHVRNLNLPIPLPFQNMKALNLLGPNASVYDIAAEPALSPGKYDLYASHFDMEPEGGCLFIQLSKAVVSIDASKNLRTESKWTPVFRTRPCWRLPSMPAGTKRVPNTTGGRIAFSPEGIVLSTGTFKVSSQNDQTDLGKILLLKRESFAKQVLSKGHRNPQGLYVDEEGTIFETEHAERGGDEINRIERGKNYGWPIVTYGTNYDETTWCNWYRGGCKERQGTEPEIQNQHEGYEKPLFAFVPSVGTSQILRVKSEQQFPIWKGDLLVASMVGRTLYRLHYDDGRIVVNEPIALGSRLRDMVELEDGRLAILTDSREILFLSTAEPKPETARQPELLGVLNSKELHQMVEGAIGGGDRNRGEKLFREACSGCHSNSASEVLAGPPLGCIFGAPVAGRSGYAYSRKIRQLGDRRWTENNLRSLFVQPADWTTSSMSNTRIEAPVDRKDLVAYLADLSAAECRTTQSVAE
jgi:cytochrome c2